jgi:protein-disulfide isomerase
MATLKIPVGPDDHAQGRADAPVTLVEYGDYQCPYCGEAYPFIRTLQDRFGDDLRFIYRNFPIAEMHPHAMSAAATAEFAGAHDQFWQAHDAIYENQRQLGLPLYERIVTEHGLSPEDLRTSLQEGRFVPRITRDFQGGVRSGVNGTPSFFINGQRFDGYSGEESLADALAAAIAQRGSGT